MVDLIRMDDRKEGREWQMAVIEVEVIGVRFFHSIITRTIMPHSSQGRGLDSGKYPKRAIRMFTRAMLR
jgi:hypothetical protein